MTQVKQNNITFNNVKKGGLELPIWPIILKKQIGPDIDGGVVNAIDIDWNEAQLNLPLLGGTRTISTTGDLLGIIEELNDLISNLIQIEVSNIVIDKDSVSVPTNESVEITAFIEPINVANKTILWNSSDNNIATVTPYTQSGEPATITWVGPGTVTITAIASDKPSKTVTCEVICQNPKYLYIGTEKPNSLILANQVESYESEYLYKNTCGEKSCIYVLTNEEVNVNFYDTIFNGEISSEIDKITIPGYCIWKTSIRIAINGSVRIRIN